MEQMPHHREGIQNDLDKAYDKGQRDNKAIDEQVEGVEKKKVFELWESIITKLGVKIGDDIVVGYKDDVGHRVESGIFEFVEINEDFLIARGHTFLGQKTKKVLGLGNIVNIRIPSRVSAG